MRCISLSRYFVDCYLCDWYNQVKSALANLTQDKILVLFSIKFTP